MEQFEGTSWRELSRPVEPQHATVFEEAYGLEGSALIGGDALQPGGQTGLPALPSRSEIWQQILTRPVPSGHVPGPNAGHHEVNDYLTVRYLNGHQDAFDRLRQEALGGLNLSSIIRYNELVLVRSIDQFNRAQRANDQALRQDALQALARLSLNRTNVAEFAETFINANATASEVRQIFGGARTREARGVQAVADAYVDFLRVPSPTSMQRLQQCFESAPNPQLLPAMRWAQALSVANEIERHVATPVLVEALRYNPDPLIRLLQTIRTNGAHSEQMRTLLGAADARELIRRLNEGTSETRAAILEEIRRSLAPRLAEMQRERATLAALPLPPLQMLLLFANRPAEIGAAAVAARAQSERLNSQFDSIEGSFLTRPAAGQEAQADRQRQALLLRLHAFAQQHFLSGGSTDRILHIANLEAFHQLLRVRDRQTPADVIAALRSLDQMRTSGNTHAARYLSLILRTGQSGSQTMDQLIESLQGDNAGPNLVQLRLRLGFVNVEQDRLTLLNIMRPFGSSELPTSNQVEAAQRRLQEAQRSGVAGAGQLLDWLNVTTQVLRLSTSGNRQPDTRVRQDALRVLAQQAGNGNADALSSIIAMLLPQSQRAHAPVNDSTRPIYVVDLQHLSSADRSRLRSDAVENLSTLLGRGQGLTAAQSKALALALSAATADGDTAVAAALRRLLQVAVAGASATQVTEGIFEALRLFPPDSRVLADVFLQGLRGQDAPRYFSSIAMWARNGDSTGIYLLSGIAGGVTGHPELTLGAVQILEQLTSTAALRPLVVQALVERFGTAGDNGRILATLGRIAGSWTDMPDRTRDSVRQALRRGFDGCVNNEGIPLSGHRERLASAAQGLLHCARHWEAQDVTRLTRRITPESARHFASLGDQVPAALQRQLATGLVSRLSHDVPAAEWPLALTALGHCARYLSATDVRALSRFSTDVVDRLPAGAIRQQLQLAVGRTFLQIVSQGGETARPSAVEHFGRCGWVRSLAHELGPNAARDLVAYARGNPTDVTSLARIAGLLYGTEIPMPLILVVRGLGYRDITPERLQEAVRRLGGEQAVRTLLDRIVAYNALPPALQALVRSDRSSLTAVRPVDLQQPPARINVKDLIDHIARHGAVPATQSFLSADIIARINHLRTIALADITDLLPGGMNQTRLHQTLIDMRHGVASSTRAAVLDNPGGAARREQTDATVAELCRVTRDGQDTSLWWLCFGILGYSLARWAPGGGQSQFNARQAEIVARLEALGTNAATVVASARRLQAIVQAVDVSTQTLQQFTLAAAGQGLQADTLRLTMVQEHGEALLTTQAPLVMQELQGTGEEAWQRGTWGRLVRNGLTQTDSLPVFQFGTPQGFQQGLRQLSSAELNFRLPEDDPRRFDANYQQLVQAACRAIRADAARAIDSHPALANATISCGEIARILPDLRRLFQSGMEGTRGPEFVTYCRGLGTRLTTALDSLRDNMPVLRQCLQQLIAARVIATNEQARAELDQRIRCLTDITTDMNPDSRSYNEMRSLCRMLRSGSFDESTLWRWLRDNGPVIIGTIAIAAACVATFGTATPLAILAVATISAAGGLLLREGWAELSYGMDWTAHGSLLGNAVRRDRVGHLVYDARTGSFGMAPTVTEALTTYGMQFAADVVLQLALMGFGAGVGRILDSCSQVAQRNVARLALRESIARIAGFEQCMAQLQPPARSWMRTFMTEMAHQSSFAVVQHATTEGLQHTFNTQHFLIEIGSAFLLCALARGGTHMWQHHIGPRSRSPGRIELPVERETFLEVLRTRLAANGSVPHRIELIGTNQAKFHVGGQVFDILFTPVTAATLQRLDVMRASLMSALTQARFSPSEAALENETYMTELLKNHPELLQQYHAYRSARREAAPELLAAPRLRLREQAEATPQTPMADGNRPAESPQQRALLQSLNRHIQQATGAWQDLTQTEAYKRNGIAGVEAEINSRIAQLNRAVRAWCREHNLPDIEVTRQASQYEAYYLTGHGAIRIDPTSVLGLHARSLMGHEITHYQQDVLTVMHLCDLSGIGRTSTRQQREVVREMYRTSNGHGINMQFLERIITHRNGVRLTEQQATRAQRLLASHQMLSARRLVADLANNPQLLQRLYGPNVPEPIARLIQSHRDIVSGKQSLSSWNHDTATSLLETHARTGQRDRITEMLDQRYRSSYHEREATESETVINWDSP